MNSSAFVEMPANKVSIAKRKLIFGVGKNDADYVVCPLVNGKLVKCKIYQSWAKMLERCYCDKFREKYPTYKDCSVSIEWLTFSNFKAWVITQDWRGKQLDKDIIVPGNKTYSPETCCFVSGSLNSLLTDHAAGRGEHPIGVYLFKRTGRYKAQVRCCGKKQRGLGYYDTAHQASDAYIKAKTEIILQAASEQTDPRIANGLRLHAKLLRGKA